MTTDDVEDDGTMPENVAALAQAVVGHRIVRVDRNVSDPPSGGVGGAWYTTRVQTGLRLTLDDGRAVYVSDSSDCCAYTELEDVIEHLPAIDHIITAVKADDDYNTWHILADLGEVMELKVGWSPGNPFYYGYGFSITVAPAEVTR